LAAWRLGGSSPRRRAGGRRPANESPTQDDSVRLARTHLRVERVLDENPSIRDEEIPPPVFIIGWPRTGSTALHTLLAADPASRTIPYWESFDPVPPRTGPDRRAEKLERMLAQLERISPDYHAIHPMAPDMTEECVALFMNHFRTLQFDFQYRIPGYVDWMLGQDARIAYSAYHDSLRLIHHFRPGGERFLLKDPTHLIHIETILQEWPDAKIIFTHRDPVFAISSLCSLQAHTRAIFSDDVDSIAIGEEIMAGHWPRALDAALALRERLPREQSRSETTRALRCGASSTKRPRSPAASMTTAWRDSGCIPRPSASDGRATARPSISGLRRNGLGPSRVPVSGLDEAHLQTVTCPHGFLSRVLASTLRLYGVGRVKVGVIAHGLRSCEVVLGVVGERVFVVLDHGAFVVPFVYG